MGAFSRRGVHKYADSLEPVFPLFPRLKERRRQKAGTFSGGEQQMLAGTVTVWVSRRNFDYITYFYLDYGLKLMY